MTVAGIAAYQAALKNGDLTEFPQFGV